jgi:hypothetical protein
MLGACALSPQLHGRQLVSRYLWLRQLSQVNGHDFHLPAPGYFTKPDNIFLAKESF